jgi:hypothetical protein
LLKTLGDRARHQVSSRDDLRQPDFGCEDEGIMTAGWRAIRAAMFAALCVLLAALAHTLMSGRPVPWWALTAAALAMGGASWALAGRERGRRLIVSSVVIAQGLLHLGFSLAQSAQRPAVPGMGGMDMGGMDMSGMDPQEHAAYMASMGMGSMGAGGTPRTTHMGVDYMGHLRPGWLSMGLPSPIGMYAAHVLAAVLCGLWLAYGEHFAHRMLRAVAAWLTVPLRLLLVHRVPRRRSRALVRRGRSSKRPRRLHLVHGITSRGPPLGPAVA